MILSKSKAGTPEKQARKRLEAAKPGASLKSMFKGCDDEVWLWVLTEGREHEPRLKALLPDLPPEKFQMQFTGRSGRLAFEQAVRGINGFLGQARALGLDLDRPDLKVMDMGCGWGRLTQTLLRDFEPDQIIGADVMPAAIQTCRELRTPGELVLMDYFPPTRIPDASVDLVIAFSVFSHLSEPAHLAWRDELARILRPGGVFAGTTRPRSFMAYVTKLREQGDAVPEHARGGALSFQGSEDWLGRYDRGSFCFDRPHPGHWPGDYYGEAAVPRAYVLERWAERFDAVNFLDDREHGLFDQAMFAARKAR